MKADYVIRINNNDNELHLYHGWSENKIKMRVAEILLDLGDGAKVDVFKVDYKFSKQMEILIKDVRL